MLRGMPLLLIVFGSGLLAGCGGDASTDGSGGNQGALIEVGEMFKSLHQEGRKPPATKADTADVDPMMPVATPLIQDGTIIVLWGAGYEAGSQKVLAYENKTPTEGGYVLLQDGTVKEMTAAEFAAAPKVKK